MSTRLEFRVSEEDKRLIERAARSSHETMTSFILRTVRTAARETLRNDEVTPVPEEFYEAMIASLEQPAEPNHALASAAKRAREVLKR